MSDINKEPIRGSDLSFLQNLLGAKAADLQRVLGISAYDWSIYTKSMAEDGKTPVLVEPSVAILVRTYLDDPDACPIPRPPNVEEVFELVNADRVSKAEVRETEQSKGVKPGPRLSYFERARQLGLRLQIPHVVFAMVLGKEKSAASRWSRGGSVPPSVANLLIYIKSRIEKDGDSQVFDELIETAQKEATARQMGDLWESKSWKTNTRAELLKSVGK